MNDATLYSDEARNRFLALVPHAQRGILTNHFLNEGPRRRVTDPPRVVAAVAAELRRRIGRALSEEQADRLAVLLRAVAENPDAAEGFAGWCVAYHAAPPEAVRAMKAERGGEHRRRWMAARPPSPKQVAYLVSLGHRGEPPASMQEASDLIEGLKSGKGVRRG